MNVLIAVTQTTSRVTNWNAHCRPVRCALANLDRVCGAKGRKVEKELRQQQPPSQRSNLLAADTSSGTSLGIVQRVSTRTGPRRDRRQC